ncbi:hypothetical protein C8R46DRAFT_1081426 [Mycena filopes]|nr:hypothetical protein C8R46DRAFT_1081426 [Mycena filopes]
MKSVEAWDFNDPDNGVFGFTSLFWEHNGEIYLYRCPQQNPSPEVVHELFQKAVVIPRGYYLGELPPSGAATLYVPDPTVPAYFKKIEPYTYDPNESRTAAADLTHEMWVCEDLRRSLHQNVCKYLGYEPTPDGKRLLGLYFERHEMHLFSAVHDKVVFDPDAVVDGVRQGLEHLHSLGYAHNDINPANILLQAGDTTRPVIIDFDSCHQIGESLKGKKAGTPGWDYESDVSLAQNDFDGLAKVQTWLEETYTTS